MSSQTLAADSIAERGTLTSPSPNLVLYDGVCGLCNRLVSFLIAVDRQSQLCFAPLQGTTAGRLRDRIGFADDLDTVVYARGFGTPDERVYYRSDAILAALADCGGVFLAAGALRLVPRPLRDAVYSFVAGRRYGWFGRYDSCPLPSPEVRARFLP